MSLDRLIDDAKRDIAAALAAGASPCVTSSFQHDCVALLHLLIEQRPEIPVLFLETGYHFPETLAYRDRMTRAWNLNLRNLSLAPERRRAGIAVRHPESDRARSMLRDAQSGTAVRRSSPFDTWFTALRREQSPTRANLQVSDDFRLPSGNAIRKISPLAAWTNRDVWAYLDRHSIPALPLYDQGYTSIGCQPCTSLPLSRTICVRAAGRARNWNAAFIFRPKPVTPNN